MKLSRLLTWALTTIAIVSILDGQRVRRELARERDKHEQHEAFIKACHSLDEFYSFHYCLKGDNPGGSSGALNTRATVESFLKVAAPEAGQRIIDFTSRYGQPVGMGADWSEGATILKWYLQDHEPKMASELAHCIKQPADGFISAALLAIEMKERRQPDDILPVDFAVQKVKTVFTLEQDITGLGERGDTIWQLTFPSVVRWGQHRYAWVNAGTGKVKFLAEYETYATPELNSNGDKSRRLD